MAAGDTSATRIQANGWVAELDIDGFKIGGNVGRGNQVDGVNANATVQYDLTPTHVVEASRKLKLAVTSSGTDSTGATVSVSRTIYGTISLRNPYSVANAEHTNDETDNTTYITIRLALEDQIFSGDTVVLIRANADLYRDNGSGGSDSQSAAVTNGAVTNNSTALAPRPVCGLATAPMQRIGSSGITSFDVSVSHAYGQENPITRIGQMAQAVEMTWTGGTSANVVTKVITSTTLKAFTTTGLYGDFFTGTLDSSDLSGFTQGEAINFKFRVFPFVGPIFDPATYGETWPTPNLAVTYPFVCDKTGALRTWATVNQSTGLLTSTLTEAALTAGLSTTDVEQTNPALIYDSPDAALKALNTLNGSMAGGIVYLQAGTYATWNNGKNLTSTTLTKGSHFAKITHAPSTNKAGVIITSTAGQTVSSGTTNRRLGSHLQFEDVTITTLANSTAADNVILWGPDTTATQTQFIHLKNCTITGLSTHTSPTSPFSNCTQYLVDNVVTGMRQLCFNAAGGKFLPIISGNSFDTCGSIAVWLCVGNNHTNIVMATFTGSLVDTGATVATVIAATGPIAAFNRVCNAQAMYVCPTGSPERTYSNGFAFVQNVIERTNCVTSSSPATAFSADGDVTPNDHFIEVGNTIVGERSNGPYNDQGTTPTYKRICRRFNIYTNHFIKRDTANVAPTGKHAGKTGNWISSHGVRCRGNLQYRWSFGKTSCSPNSDVGDWTDVSPFTIPTLVNYFIDFKAGIAGNTDASSSNAASDGAGQGNYGLLPGSPAANMIPAGQAMLAHDLYGKAIPNNGTGCAGAIQAITSYPMSRGRKRNRSKSILLVGR